MLDYDLVTAKAAYRILKPADVPALLALAAEFHGGDPAARDRILSTVAELNRHRRSGSLFVIERGEDLAGYCILVNCWSSALGGTVLCIDEIYVSPAHRRRGIATDFIELLAKVAPEGTVAIRHDADGSRRTLGWARRLGFREAAGKALVRRIGREEAGR